MAPPFIGVMRTFDIQGRVDDRVRAEVGIDLVQLGFVQLKVVVLVPIFLIKQKSLAKAIPVFAGTEGSLDREPCERLYFIPHKSVLSRPSDRLVANTVGHRLWLEVTDVSRPSK